MTMQVTISVPAGAPWQGEVEVQDRYQGKLSGNVEVIKPGETRTLYCTSTRQLHVVEAPLPPAPVPSTDTP